MDLLPFFSIFLISSSLAQQPYIREAETSCSITNRSTTVLGYFCNGARRSCQSYLTFRATPPYDSVSAISTLLGANSSQLSQLNSVPESSTIFESDQLVLVPVTCSCSGQYYQANVSYIIKNTDTPLVIANNTFQGLSTCQAIDFEIGNRPTDLQDGASLNVPLRCACPTKSQVHHGVKYLLSYLITWNDYVDAISLTFGVDAESTLAANELSDEDNEIYPFTTLLVPLQDPPSGSSVTTASPPATSVIILAPPPTVSGSGGKSKTWVYYLVSALGGFALAAVIGVLVFFACIRKRKNRTEPVMSLERVESVKRLRKRKGDINPEELLEGLSMVAQSLNVYSFQELKVATEDFGPSSWIKGSVYRGTIDGDFAAIKKVNGELSKEIKIPNKFNHFNLIRLFGVCFNDGDWYLIYEYASNGPLNDWIHHHNDERETMSWKQRLQIVLDIATGLNYLHCYASPPHVHKNLNSDNILINHDFRAKIANLRLARSAEGQGGEFILTSHIVGTKGYMAPEYLEHGLISPKLDVYAFGVLMLEILTGTEVSLLYEENLQLSDVLNPVLHHENGLENIDALMDPLLQGNYPPEPAFFIFRLIDRCLSKDPSDRPSTDEIFQFLSRISDSTPSYEWAIGISGQDIMM
ncbi:lysM domain receptor-like kinase 4 [Henckelia pumila]|uniref:lysM domain receptor-like kinase 4 n=1 Tax=Henckelia pumila TaxID=405737 RepID=UPI003C6E9226